MTWLMLAGVTVVLCSGIATVWLILRDHRRRMAALQPPIMRVPLPEAHLPNEVCDMLRMRLNRQAEQISELTDQLKQHTGQISEAKIAFIIHFLVTMAMLSVLAVLAIRVWGL